MKRRLRRLGRRLRHRPEVALLWRSLMFRTTVIAITGSVGKSTCKELLYAILSERAPTYKTPNNENDLFGVPAVLLGLRPWHRFAVIELAASGPGTLSRLARIVRPDVAIITAVARTHTNRYQDADEIAREKATLLTHLRPNGLAVLNADDDRVGGMRPSAGQRIVFYGSGRESDFAAADVRARWPDRLALTVTCADEGHSVEHCIRTDLVGTHWVSSVMAALAASRTLGIPLEVGAARLAHVAPFRGRMQPIRLSNGAVMIRDENASLDVLQAMLEVARSARAKRTILVLGEITDSGIRRTQPRAALAGQLAAENVDVAIFVGGFAERAARAAIQSGLAECHVFCAADIRAADGLLATLVAPGDLVFLKGLSSQHLSRLAFARIGSIDCWVEHCSIRKDCDICPRLRPGFDLAPALRWVS